MGGLRVVVGVKLVPDQDAVRSLPGGRLVRNAVDGTLDEGSEDALALALNALDALPDADRAASEVVAVAVGPAAAEHALRRAYQLGADRGVLVADPRLEGADLVATATALAATVARLDTNRRVDLVVLGAESGDGHGGTVPALVGSVLGRPTVGRAGSLTVTTTGTPTTTGAEPPEARGVLDARTAPGARFGVRLPAVVSAARGAGGVRVPNPASAAAARTRPVERWTLDDLDAAAHGLGLTPGTVGRSRTRVLTARPHVRPTPRVVVDDGTAGVALAEFLIAHDALEVPCPSTR